MSDQNGGKTEASEADSKPRTNPDAPSGAFPEHNRVPPVIEGEALDVTPAPAANAPLTEDSAPSGEREAEPVSEAEPKTEAARPATDDPPRSRGALRPVAILIGAVALGGGAYYLWDAYVAAPPATPAAAPEPPRLAAAEKPEPAAAPVSDAPKQAEPAALAKPRPEPAQAGPVESRPVEPSPTAANQEAERAVADMAAKLAAAQAAVERLTQRLQTVEGQLAAPKIDARAALSTRDLGPNNAGDAAARLVVAQSLLTALRQGDDYSAQLTALQNFGGDSVRLARLRAGLSAPTLNRLATEFSALAPKLATAATPPKPAEESGSPQGARDSVLGYIQSQARKLVRIRPAGAPDKDATALQFEKIEKELRAGDLVAALALRLQLPAPALAISADWAREAQTRLDAETAAKAELSEALQNLTKTKS